MTDQNGWPSKPGYPLNPERDGVHAIDVDDDVWLSGWDSKTNVWDFGCTGTHIDAASFAQHCAEQGYRYLGPICTPDEVAALVETARREEREACAKVAEGKTYKGRYRTWPWWINRDGSEGNRSNDSDIVEHADQIAAAIRARGDA
jgi:hypothetical protein